MPQKVQKKTTNSARRKTQASTTKNRKSVQHPKKTMASQKKVTKITPVIIDKKEEVVILPTNNNANKQVQKQQVQQKQQVKQKQQMKQKQQVQAQQKQQMEQQAQQKNVVSAKQSQSSMNTRRTIDMVAIRERMEMQNAQMANSQMASTQVKTARQIKEDAIQKAMMTSASEPQMKKRSHGKVHFGFKRVVLAMACAAAAVFAIVYFVNLNKPDLSLRVAAIQNGIDAVYPKYIPRGFDLSDITSESGRITLNFKNPTTGDAFAIIEEKSAWDSNALFTNFVRPNYSSAYATIKEQGLTIYIDGSNACWVNGGVVFKLKVTSGSLTKKQITTIATTR